jgi:molybdopterin molybdotransferase
MLAKLTVNLPSKAGREDWVAVRLLPNHLIPNPLPQDDKKRLTGEPAYLAEPVFGKSNLIFSLAAADGLVRIPPDATGLSAGEMVEVVLI